MWFDDLSALALIISIIRKLEEQIVRRKSNQRVILEEKKDTKSIIIGYQGLKKKTYINTEQSLSIKQKQYILQGRNCNQHCQKLKYLKE